MRHINPLQPHDEGKYWNQPLQKQIKMRCASCPWQSKTKSERRIELLRQLDILSKFRREIHFHNHPDVEKQTLWGLVIIS
jgi:hypothetical protein